MDDLWTVSLLPVPCQSGRYQLLAARETLICLSWDICYIELCAMKERRRDGDEETELCALDRSAPSAAAYGSRLLQ